MPFLDRDSLIALLDRLGDADDAKAMAAAREKSHWKPAGARQ